MEISNIESARNYSSKKLSTRKLIKEKNIDEKHFVIIIFLI